MKIRDRIKELRRIKASEILPNPKNWRTHPTEQQNALRGVMAEIGMADAVLARVVEGGKLMLVDGHMRVEAAGDSVIPVLVLDLDDEEADKILATFDPIANMAGSDPEALEKLLAGISTDSDALNEMLEQLAKDNGIFEREVEEAGGDDSGEETPGQEEEALPPPSGVRMVQLFFNEKTIVDFQRYAEELGRRYKTDNITDTVLEALRRESDSSKG